MLMNISQKRLYLTMFLVTTLFLLQGCNSDPLNVDVSNIEVEQEVQRLEHDLFAAENPMNPDRLAELRTAYGSFFDLYCLQILNLKDQPDSIWIAELNRFCTDPDMQDIYKMSDSLYADFSNIEDQLNQCFRYYKYHFPNKPVPRIVTMLSAIQYSFIVTDSVLGMALDKYLGADCVFYPALGFPQFLSDKLTPEYLAIDAMEAWYLSDHPETETGEEMLDKMIHRGKMLYFIDAVAYGYHDSLKIGFSDRQLQWCEDNEYFLWSYFIEHKLLFSTNFQKYQKFIDDGNSTSGFPPEAPAQLATFIGWQIVRSYMQNEDLSLPDLLAESDAREILKKSKYKPQRN